MHVAFSSGSVLLPFDSREDSLMLQSGSVTTDHVTVSETRVK
jgi:hypothetical protein